MADTGGPYFPCDPPCPETNTLAYGPYVYAAGSPNIAPDQLGMQFPASLAGNATWSLRWRMPAVLPATGSAYLRLSCMSQATSGNAKFNPQWDIFAPPGVPATRTLTGEAGQPFTITPSVADQMFDTDIALAAHTVAANQEIVMALQGLTASWTLAKVLWVRASIIYK